MLNLLRVILVTTSLHLEEGVAMVDEVVVVEVAPFLGEGGHSDHWKLVPQEVEASFLGVEDQEA